MTAAGETPDRPPSQERGQESKKKIKKLRGKLKSKTLPGSEVDKVPAYDRNDYKSVDEESGRLQLVQNKIDARLAKAAKTSILDFSASRAAAAFRFDFNAFPREVFNVCVSLRELWLTNNAISILTADIRALSNLTTLGLGGNQLTGLPSDIGALKNLERLFLDRNNISSIPSEVAELKKLVEIRLDHNHLHHAPEIAALRNLRRIGLSFNKFVDIPAGICRLSNLIELDLDNNQIEEVPVELTRLKMTLQQLGLANNLLGEKPVFLDNMANLRIVRLSGNRKSLGVPIPVSSSMFLPCF